MKRPHRTGDRGRTLTRDSRAGTTPVRAAPTPRAALLTCAFLLLATAAFATEAVRSGARPFEHRRHESVSCRTCHGTGDQHRTLLIRTPFDCASCHHDAARTASCASCHETEQLPNGVRVGVTLTLSVWDSARTRDLPFGHAVHAGRECQECHATPVTLAPSEECGACHESHHRAAANCASCHERVERSAHPAAAHLSCAGGGCHAPRVAPAPALSRTLCLACHTDRAAHEPADACAGCHRVGPRGSGP